MQILIEISKEAYEKIQTKSMLISASAIEEVVDAVKHGRVGNDWIPIKFRAITDEELKRYKKYDEYDFDCDGTGNHHDRVFYTG